MTVSRGDQASKMLTHAAHVTGEVLISSVPRLAHPAERLQAPAILLGRAQLALDGCVPAPEHIHVSAHLAEHVDAALCFRDETNMERADGRDVLFEIDV